MKGKIFDSVILTILLGLTIAVPAMGDKTSTGREESIIHSKKCVDTSASLHEKSRELQEEITRGARIYTPAEIKRLEGMLKDTEELLDSMMHRPGDAEAGTVKKSASPLE